MIDQVIEALEMQFVGRREVLRLALTALMCGGHLLIEDVPGVGKTTLAKALSAVFGCSLGRIQCTADLLPADVLGYSLFDRTAGAMVFHKGPIHHQIVLVDEINRATPKTQSCMLEAMEENQVTVEGVTYPMQMPFWVVATQNPAAFEGTFPLPEAQLDRFFMRLSIGYPADAAQELAVISRRRGVAPVITPLLEPAVLKALQQEIESVRVPPELERYIAELVRSTRTAEGVALGVSPRGTIALYSAAKGWAYINGRRWVEPEDIRQVALPVLAHRVQMNPEATYHGVTARQVLSEILQRTTVPKVSPHEPQS